MMAQESTTHPYLRASSFDGDDSISLLARRVRSGATVLDIGAGQGELGRLLSDNTVDGIDLSSEAAAKASPFYRRFWVSDLNEEGLAKVATEGESYDFIVIADVLEHLLSPDKLIAEAKGLLSEDGCMLISLPNVAYVGLVAELIQGHFTYRETGLLDRTHLRFYTDDSARELFLDQGLCPAWSGFVRMEPRSSEFGQGPVQSLPASVRRALLSDTRALDYQLLYELRCGDGSLVSERKESRVAQPMSHFAEIFWRSADEAFDAERSVAFVGQMSESVSILDIEIPLDDFREQQLRVDLADREGLVEVHRIELLGLEGVVCWTWDQTSVSSLHDLVIQKQSDRTVLLGLLGNDPQLVLPFFSNDEKLRGRLTMRLKVSWPVSLVAQRLGESLHQSETQMGLLSAELQSKKKHIDELQFELAALKAKFVNRAVARLKHLLKRS